jgi:hypothetical protein
MTQIAQIIIHKRSSHIKNETNKPKSRRFRFVFFVFIWEICVICGFCLLPANFAHSPVEGDFTLGQAVAPGFVPNAIQDNLA